MSDDIQHWDQLACDYRAGLVEEAWALFLLAPEGLQERARELHGDLASGELSIDAGSEEIADLEALIALEREPESWVVRWADLKDKIL